MRRHTSEELAHLKWKLINQDDLSPTEADERIKESLEWYDKNKKNLKVGEKNEIKGEGLSVRKAKSFV